MARALGRAAAARGALHEVPAPRHGPDERALLRALDDGHISAGLDVYDEEPLPVDHPLRAAPNTVLSPHLGFSTVENIGDFYRGSVVNIMAYLDGKPVNVANPDVLKRGIRKD